MAKGSAITMRNWTIYSVFVRNHTPEGTFAALHRDLAHIKALGVDVIWFLPIHPIGQLNRKGSLGSPYAIADYRAVNPEYGTLQEFKDLVDDIHIHGMRCIIDVVYNHTSPDSWLVQNHPEWFYKDSNGKMGNRIGEWSDVVDLDYVHTALWEYQIETLVEWASIVDGFRCDVASLVPVHFWLAARRVVEKVCPGCIWLAETVHPGFITQNRHRGYLAQADCEMYSAFDICYDYDVHDYFQAYVERKIPLSRYAEMLAQQETIYPANYVKLRFLENHDHARAKALFQDSCMLRNWTAMFYFLKGTALLYAGQEVCNTHTPSLFEKDPVVWQTGQDISPLLNRLYQIKQDPLFAEGNYTVWGDDEWNIMVCRYEKLNKQLYGLFCLRGNGGIIPVMLPDGDYHNLLDGALATVKGGKVELWGEPLILSC